jgi:hypothetical protein
LVANTVKYLAAQPIIGVNPDPGRYDGQLLPFGVPDLAKIVPEAFAGTRPTKTVTMAQARLNNGQTLHAVNDLFIGPKSHGSARYVIHRGAQTERQSSSGVIISTGLGSTGWFTSLITGARGVAAAFGAGRGDRASQPPAPDPRGRNPGDGSDGIRFPWDADYLCFTVREPFPSKTSATSMVFGQIESQMPERGVIFSDGIESDFLEFNSGTKAEITVSSRRGCLVV